MGHSEGWERVGDNIDAHQILIKAQVAVTNDPDWESKARNLERNIELYSAFVMLVRAGWHVLGLAEPY